MVAGAAGIGVCGVVAGCVRSRGNAVQGRVCGRVRAAVTLCDAGHRGCVAQAYADVKRHMRGTRGCGREVDVTPGECGGRPIPELADA